MADNKFKISDYVMVVSDDAHVELQAFKGMVLQVDCIDEGTIKVKTLDGKYVVSSSQFFKSARFEKFTGDIKSLPKPKQYICVKISCGNICGSIKQTIDIAKNQVSDGTEHIIYELTPIMKITTQQVTENL